MYTISCPEGMERDGGDDVSICTGDGNSTSAVGVWSGTAPTCTGMYFLHLYIIIWTLLKFVFAYSSEGVSISWGHTLLCQQ